MNFGYHDKRISYLFYLSKALGEYDVSVDFFANDRAKPMLSVARGDGKCVVNIIPFIFPQGRLQLKSFLPSKSNVEDAGHYSSVAHYNSSIAEDTQLVSHLNLFHELLSSASLKQTVLMLKLWLRKRDYGKEFSGFHAACVVCFLAASGAVKPRMDAYAIFRVVLGFFVSADFSTCVSWPSSSIPEQIEESFQEAFELSLIGPSGAVNMFARVTRRVWSELQMDAASTLQALDHWSSGDSFRSIFIQKVSFVSKFDVVVVVKKRKARRKKKTLPSGEEIANLLHRGLGKRASVVSFREDEEVLRFGVILDPQKAFLKLEAGPPAEDKKGCAVFRKFWGERSQLRRFKDGKIMESVVWDCGFEKQHQIPSMIMSYLLTFHFGIPEASFVSVSDQLDSLLSLINPFNPEQRSATGDGVSLHMNHVLQDLVSKLRNLPNMPLDVSTTFAVHPAFRYCATFPPSENGFAGTNKGKKASECQTLVVEPLQVIVQYVPSGSWPEDPAAIQVIKQAFYLKTGEELLDSFKIHSVVNFDSLDVLFKGFVFRLSIFHHREIALSKKAKKKELQLEFEHRPRHASAIHALVMKHKSFGNAVRLCKRWLHAHLMSGQIADEAVELMVAHVYTFPHVFGSVPSLPIVGFFRWLKLVASWEWGEDPLIVSLNEHKFSAQEIFEIRHNMQSSIKDTPFVASELDNRSVWTNKKLPSAMMMKRIVRLAKYADRMVEEALAEGGRKMEEKLLGVFKHSFEDYDFVIHLRQEAIPQFWQGIGYHVRSKQKEVRRDKLPQGDASKLWIVSQWKNLRRWQSVEEVKDHLLIGFNPAMQFVEELRERFGKYALFLVDENGGDRIGAVWVPGAFEERKMNVRNSRASKPSKSLKGVVLNKEDVFEEIRAIGYDLLRKIKERTS